MLIFSSFTSSFVLFALVSSFHSPSCFHVQSCSSWRLVLLWGRKNGSIMIMQLMALGLCLTRLSAAAASTLVGDYIARGVGVTNTTSTSTLSSLSPSASIDTTSLASTSPPVDSGTQQIATITETETVNGTIFTATVLADGDLLVNGSTVHASYQTASSTQGFNDATATLSTSSLTPVDPTQPIATATVTIYGESTQTITATVLEDGIILEASTTVYPASLIANTTQTVPLPGSPGNGSVDECFSSWAAYLSISSWDAQQGPVIVPTSSSEDSYTLTNEAITAATLTETITYSTLVTPVDGGHTLSESLLDSTTTEIWTVAYQPATTQTLDGGGSIFGITYTPSIALPPKPTCVLPSYVEACETEWEHWVTTQLAPSPTPPSHCDFTHYYYFNASLSTPACASTYFASMTSYESFIAATASPICTQASIGGSLCQSVRENYVAYENPVFVPTGFGNAGFGYFFSQGTIAWYDTSAVLTSTWPTSSTLNIPYDPLLD